MDNLTTADEVVVALRPHAVTAVRQAQTDRPDNFRLWAVKLLRDATGCHLGDGLKAVDWATAHLAAMRLDQHRVASSHGWVYEFPNGHGVSVINDHRTPFRFEVCSKSLNVGGDLITGLTSEQVEAKLHEIAALPAA